MTVDTGIKSGDGMATPTEASGVGILAAALLLGEVRGRLDRLTLSQSRDSPVKSLRRLFYLKGVAGNLLSMRDSYLGIIPFVIMQLI